VKAFLILVQTTSIILGSSSFVLAHSVLSREVKVSGDYQAVMEATADVPDHYERFAITYTYLLLNKDGSQYVSFDYAKVNFAPKKGGLIMKAELDGPKNGLSGTELDVAMPAPGDYETEVAFYKNGQSKELARASFDFFVIAMPKATSTEPGATTQPPPTNSNSVPRYVWAIILFVLGIVAGRLTPKVYQWTFSN
jgi:hypothetical protein